MAAGLGFATARDEGVWDWQQLDSGTPGTVTFFGDGIQGRGYADTNLETPGQLPGDREQAVQGIALFMGGIAQDVTASDALVEDVFTVAQYAALVFKINNNVALRVPAAMAGGDFGATGQFGDVASGFMQLGSPGSLGYIISDPQRFIVVPSNATISVELNWSKNASLPSINSNRRLGVFLRGPQAFQAGRA